MTEVNDDVPTLVFSGTYAEALFLKTIMESAGRLYFVNVWLHVGAAFLTSSRSCGGMSSSPVS